MQPPSKSHSHIQSWNGKWEKGKFCDAFNFWAENQKYFLLLWWDVAEVWCKLPGPTKAKCPKMFKIVAQMETFTAKICFYEQAKRCMKICIHACAYTYMAFDQNVWSFVRPFCVPHPRSNDCAKTLLCEMKGRHFDSQTKRMHLLACLRRELS